MEETEWGEERSRSSYKMRIGCNIFARMNVLFAIIMATRMYIFSLALLHEQARSRKERKGKKSNIQLGKKRSRRRRRWRKKK